MEKTQDLMLIVPANKERIFLERLITTSEDSGWKILAFGSDISKKEDLFSCGNNVFVTLDNDNVLTRTEDISFRFAKKDVEYKDKSLSAEVILEKKDGYYEIIICDCYWVDSTISYNDRSQNFIVSSVVRNFVLNTFFEEQLSDIVVQTKIRVVSSRPDKSMNEVIGNKAANLLKWISKNATDHIVFDLLNNVWKDFVFTIHRNNINVPHHNFMQWLEKEGWTEEMAHNLWGYLIYGLDILRCYDLENSNESEEQK